MGMLKYKIKLEDLDSPSGTITTRALFQLLQQFTAAAEKGLRLAIEGQSTKAGPAPKWLENATDFTFTGIQTGSISINLTGFLIIRYPALQSTNDTGI